MAASVTHLKLANGRLACRPFAIGRNAPVSCSTVATTNHKSVTCSRCLNSLHYKAAVNAAKLEEAR